MHLIYADDAASVHLKKKALNNNLFRLSAEQIWNGGINEGSTSQILTRKAATQLPLAHSSCSRFLNLMGCHYESQTTSIGDSLQKASNIKQDFNLR